jgi:hypothetical protein
MRELLPGRFGPSISAYFPISLTEKILGLAGRFDFQPDAAVAPKQVLLYMLSSGASNERERKEAFPILTKA